MKRERKIIGACIFIALAVFLFFGIKQYQGKQKVSSEGTHIKIGISIYDEYDTYIAALMKEVTNLAKQKEMQENIAITIDIQSAGGSQMAQNDQIESFVNGNYDVVCVSLVDRTDAAVIIDRAKSADIPIIFFNRELVKEDLERFHKTYYVGGRASEAGDLQGELVVEACKESFSKIDKNKDGVLQYVMLEGEPGHQDALFRTENSIKTVANAGYGLQKLSSGIANWNKAQATTKMTAWIEKYKEEIEVVFSNNDEMALGVIEALKKSDIKQYPIVVGVDGIEGGLDAVKKKELIGTVYNDYMGQAKVIVEMAYALSLHKEFPEDINLIDNKYVYLPYEKITYDNVQQYIRRLD